MDAVNKSKRTIVRSQTTKLINKIESRITEGNAEEEELEQYLAELDLKEKELNFLDTEIQKNIKLDELEAEVLKCDEYNSNLVIWRTKIKRAKSKLETRTNLNVTTTTTLNNTEERIISRGLESFHVNLPRLIIEKFDGDPSDWQRFWDQYESAIHKNSEIYNVDKFNYLRSYLRGVASDAIKGFSLTNNNYQSAIDTLKDRFGKKTIVINSHINKLLNLNQVKKSSDIVSLRKLLDNCQTEIRNLEALGIKEDKYGALLCPILIKLLPPDIVLEITKKYGTDDEWKVSEILDILKIEVVSREKAMALISSSNTQNTEYFAPMHKKHDRYELLNKSNKNHISTASGLLNESGIRRNKCFCCESDKHLLTDCDVFKNKQIDEKRDILMKEGCCFICFFKGHLANKCRSSVKCRICSRRHYEVMCPENKISENVESECTALSNKTCNQEVLMQTLTVCLRNKSEEILIRGLIDTGSQKSYLTKEIINKIGYTSIGQEKLNHSLFGGLQQTHEHNKYRIFLSNLNKNYSCNFEVYDQEKICAQIPKIRDGPWMKEAKKQGIYFSDYENIKGSRRNRDKEIHLLIGADVYGKLLTGEIRSLTSDLVAIETRLGWTLMGKTDQFKTTDSTNVVLSLHVVEAEISDLWKHDTSRILVSGQTSTREEFVKVDEEYFNRNIRIVEVEKGKRLVEILPKEIEVVKTDQKKVSDESSCVHEELDHKRAQMEFKYREHREEKENIAKKELQTRDTKNNTEVIRDSLLQEKSVQKEIVKDKENKPHISQDVSQMEIEAGTELINDSEVHHGVREQLHNERHNAEEKCKKFESKIQVISIITSNKNKFQTQVEEPQKLDKEKTKKFAKLEEKYLSLKESVANKKNLMAQREKEVSVSKEQYQKVFNNEVPFQNTALSLKVLEEENTTLKNKVIMLELENQEEKPVHLTNPAKPDISPESVQEIKSLLSQVDLLNFIIVDMKQQNEELTRKLEAPARSRVSFLKLITIPHLELFLCTSVRLAKGVKTDLRIRNLITLFWSNSRNTRSNTRSLNSANMSCDYSAEYLKKLHWWELSQWLRQSLILWKIQTKVLSSYEKMIQKRKAERIALLKSMEIDQIFEAICGIEQMKKNSISKYSKMVQCASKVEPIRRSKKLASLEVDFSENALQKLAQKNAIPFTELEREGKSDERRKKTKKNSKMKSNLKFQVSLTDYDEPILDLDLRDANRKKKTFAYRQKIPEDLKKRFRMKYLGQLRDIARRKKKKTQLKETDVVLNHDDNSRRINWPLGKIEAIYPGKDTKTRVVRVKTQSGSYLRPVRRIYPLEVRDKEKELLPRSV